MEIIKPSFRRFSVTQDVPLPSSCSCRFCTSIGPSRNHKSSPHCHRRGEYFGRPNRHEELFAMPNTAFHGSLGRPSKANRSLWWFWLDLCNPFCNLIARPAGRNYLTKRDCLRLLKVGRVTFLSIFFPVRFVDCHLPPAGILVLRGIRPASVFELSMPPGK